LVREFIGKKDLNASDGSVGVIGATLGLADLEFDSSFDFVSLLPRSLSSELDRERAGRCGVTFAEIVGPRMDVVRADKDGGM